MPLFSRKQEPVPAQQTAPMNRHSRVSTSSTTSPRRSGGFFSRRRNSASSFSSSDYEDNNTHRSGIGGLFSRNRQEDPSIVAARERVMHAEQAERDADVALRQARISVQEAREHVRRLELEAEAEAKAAKIKQGQARNLNKRAQPLGRKSPMKQFIPP